MQAGHKADQSGKETSMDRNTVDLERTSSRFVAPKPRLLKGQTLGVAEENDMKYRNLNLGQTDLYEWAKSRCLGCNEASPTR